MLRRLKMGNVWTKDLLEASLSDQFDINNFIEMHHQAKGQWITTINNLTQLIGIHTQLST